MIFTRIVVTIFLLTILNASFAQRFTNQVPQIKRYTPQEIVDPDYGITRYNKLVNSIGGDSIKYTKEGYNAQGWQEDYYVSGKLLHKGFYVDGFIRVFKNFYESGQLERNFTSTDPKRSKMEIFYEDGKPRSIIQYFEGNPQNQYDYFKNGTTEYIEENDKDMEYLFKRNSYSDNGMPISLFELIDKKSRRYMKKEFHDNGRLKEEGTMIFRKDLGDYQKDGNWTYYDDKGNITKTEKYFKGELQ